MLPFKFSAVVLLGLFPSLTVGLVRAEDPSGRWKGRWISNSNGHTGTIRARITPASTGGYNALYAGRFALVVPFIYRSQLTAVETSCGTVYVAEKKLGPLLGSYRTQAVIQGGSFNANWSTNGDTGSIIMQRTR